MIEVRFTEKYYEIEFGLFVDFIFYFVTFKTSHITIFNYKKEYTTKMAYFEYNILSIKSN